MDYNREVMWKMNIKRLFAGETDNTFIQFFRYCFVGGFAFVVDFGVLTFLVELFAMPHVVAATISFIAGLATNYILSTFWIFKKSNVNNRLAEFTVFAIIGVVGLLINDAIIWLFQDFLGTNLILGGYQGTENGEIKYYIFGTVQYYMVGKIAATAVSFVWNFVARKLILFNKK